VTNPNAPFNRIAQCRYGLMVYNVNDLYVGRAFDAYGEFSEGEVTLFTALVRPGDVVVEVGANMGAHTVPLAQLAGPSGAVYAFEPQRLPFQLLCANAALNSLANVWAMQAAVGTGEGMVRVPDLNPRNVQNFGGLSLPEQQLGEEVPVIALDELTLERCRLLKVDVEGMELDVLKGAARLIERCRPLAYVECDRKEKATELLQHLLACRYRVYWHAPPLFNPNNFRKNADNAYGHTVSLNVLCVPSEMPDPVNGLTPIWEELGVPYIDAFSASIRANWRR
jgi:FkbM family methyltransferase